VVAERRRGYEAALRAAGIAPDPALQVLSEDSVDDAHAAVAGLLQVDRARFTAAIAFKPLPALGLLRALRAAGLDVPRDVSVIAFGDAEWMRAYPPPITAVDQPNYEVGRAAASLLLHRAEEAQRAPAGPGTGPEADQPAAGNGTDGAPTILHVATRLIERESVA
jgi:LacI family transcriptional regulator